MNLALPALVVFLILLPGFIARSQIKLVESQSIDYSPFGRVVVQAIVWAVLIHGLWVWIIGLPAGPVLSVLRGDDSERVLAPEILLGLLSANAAAQTAAIRSVTEQWKEVTTYFLSMYAFAFIVPLGVRWVVIRYRLDRRGCLTAHLFRFPTPWYYLFKGADFRSAEQPDLVYVSAAISVAGSPYLYVGVLYDWQFDKDGALSWLTLEDVSRRPLSADKEAPSAGNVGVGRLSPAALGGEAEDVRVPEHPSGPERTLDRFYKIDGDRFILPYEQVLSLNIQYVKLNQVSMS